MKPINSNMLKISAIALFSVFSTESAYAAIVATDTDGTPGSDRVTITGDAVGNTHAVIADGAGGAIVVTDGVASGTLVSADGVSGIHTNGATKAHVWSFDVDGYTSEATNTVNQSDNRTVKLSTETFTTIKSGASNETTTGQTAFGTSTIIKNGASTSRLRHDSNGLTLDTDGTGGNGGHFTADKITSNGDADILGNLTTQGLAVGAGGAIITGGTILKGDLVVNQVTTLNGATNTNGISNTGNITNSGNIQTGTLGVVGASTFTGHTTHNGGATINNGLAVNGGASISGGLNNNGGGITNAGRISGVSDGIAANDAVNVRQLGEVSKESRSGIAATSAMAAMPSLDAGKQKAFSIGAGHFKGESAVAIGARARINNNMVAAANLGFSGGDVVTGVGATWSF